jgi:hypothetical protein
MDTFLEKDPKENSKNSLSIARQENRKYLDALKPAGKRESEQRAYGLLKQDFGDAEIADCIAHLHEHSLPRTREPSYAPMAFLAKGMAQFLALVQAKRTKAAALAERERLQTEAIGSRIEQELSEERERLERESAFVQAYPTDQQQEEIIGRYSKRYPALPSRGAAMRNLAVMAWWDEFRRAS